MGKCHEGIRILKKTSLNLIISVLFTITSFSLMLSDLRSESSALKAGIEAMNRGHYATACVHLGSWQKQEMLRPKIILGICTREGWVFLKIMACSKVV